LYEINIIAIANYPARLRRFRLRGRGKNIMGIVTLPIIFQMFIYHPNTYHCHGIQFPQPLDLGLEVYDFKSIFLFELVHRMKRNG